MNQSNKPSPVRALRLGVDPVLDSERAAARRQRIVGRIHELQSTLQAEPGVAAQQSWGASRKLSVWLWPALAAALLGAVFAVALWPNAATQGIAQLELLEGELTLTSASGAQLLQDAKRFELSEGATLETAANAARVLLPSHARAALDPKSLVAFEQVTGSATSTHDGGELLRLRRGKVGLKVPPLGPRRYLAVQTADAVVEVHGTEFTVEVEPEAPSGAPPATRVSVQEGLVSVTWHGERTFLHPGDTWTAPTPAPATTPEAPSALQPAVTPSARPSPSVRPPPAAGDLAEQNKLFAAAQRARREGRSSAALSGFEDLIRRYPRSELAHNARVEHFRLLRALGRAADARSSAASYLATYPKGFARAEAQAVLSP